MPNTPDSQKEEIFAIQNIFGKPPGWLVNWGITAAFLFLIVCLGIAAYKPKSTAYWSDFSRMFWM